MPVPLDEIVYYQSSDTDSTGGVISATEIQNEFLNNLWPNIGEADRLAGDTIYRKSFMANESATDDMLSPKVWTNGLPSGDFTERIGFGIDHADDDNSAQGTLTPLAANTVIRVVSNGADTRTATVIGLDAAGVPQTEGLTLNGTTAVTGALTFSVVYAVYLSASSGTRTVTIRRVTPSVTDIGTIAINEINCWTWLDAPTSETTAMEFDDLAFGDNLGFWHELSWIADASVSEVSTGLIVRETA